MKVTTTITIDAEVYAKCKEQKLNVSKMINMLLTNYLEVKTKEEEEYEFPTEQMINDVENEIRVTAAKLTGHKLRLKKLEEERKKKVKHIMEIEGD